MPAKITVQGQEYALAWNKRSVFLADRWGLYSREIKSIGIYETAVYVWAMLPNSGRQRYPEPVDLFEHLPPLNEIMPIINAALAESKEDANPKNVFGSTSGPLPASS